MLTTTLKESKDPKYTIICSFTRRKLIQKWITSFDQVIWADQETEIILYIDTSEKDFFDVVVALMGNYIEFFNGIKVIFGDNGIVSDQTIDTRPRISNFHKLMQEEAKGQYVIGLEDDTIYPKMTFIELIRPLLEDPKIGFIQGVEVGRRDWKVFGVWNVSEDGKIVSTSRVEKGIVPCQGGGFYCFIMPIKAYREIEFGKSVEGYGYLGPDFNAVYSLHLKGWKCLTNWAVRCGHIAQNGVLLKNAKHQAIMTKNDSGGWGVDLVDLPKK